MPPKPGQFAGFMRRHRAALDHASSPEEPVQARGSFDVSDFKFLEERLNGDLEGGTTFSIDRHLSPTDAQLRVVEMHIGPDCVVAPLLCPNLLSRVLHLLPEPYHLKISTDGTYRLMFGSDFTLLNIGVNVKHWARARPSDNETNLTAFRSRYVPLAFAIASSEASQPYARFASTFVRVCQALVPNFSPASILQWHGDMHRGVEAARLQVAPSSIRLSDWAHVTGATAPGPAGFVGLLHKYILPNDPALPLLLRWFHLSRYMPACLFHVVWVNIWQHVLGEHPVIRSLQQQYFHRTADGLWDAHWRAAPDRVMPGTAVGSSPQESWHKHVLKTLVMQKSPTPFELASKLQNSVVQHQLLDLSHMEQDGRQFQDWPLAGTHLDQNVLKGDVPLNKEGRSSAKSLFELQLHTRWADEAGNVWILVPTSKFKVRRGQGKKLHVESREPVRLPPDAARQFAILCTAKSTDVVCEALAALGLYDLASACIHSWDVAAAVFDDWRCVLIGPEVANYWQTHGVCGENDHMRSLCWFCETAGKSGPCEHSYCALLRQGVLSLEPLAKPQSRAGRPKKKAGRPIQLSGSLLQPGPLLASHSMATSPATPLVPDVSECPAPDHLMTVLQSAGLGSLRSRFVRQEATVDMLRLMSYTDFQTFFNLTLPQAHALKMALQQAGA